MDVREEDAVLRHHLRAQQERVALARLHREADAQLRGQRRRPRACGEEEVRRRANSPFAVRTARTRAVRGVEAMHLRAPRRSRPRARAPSCQPGERVAGRATGWGTWNPALTRSVRDGSSARELVARRMSSVGARSRSGASARGSAAPCARPRVRAVAHTMPCLQSSKSMPSVDHAVDERRSSARPSCASAAQPRSWSAALQYVQKRSQPRTSGAAR